MISSTGSGRNKVKNEIEYDGGEEYDFIGWLCTECRNVSGKPPMLFGYKEEGRERFNCHHVLKKVRVHTLKDGDKVFEPAHDGDPDESL
jgi:hypothetical protein